MLPRMHPIRLGLFLGAIAVSAPPSPAQNAIASPAPSPSHAIADSWNNLSVVAQHTHIHIAADHGGKTCYFISVDDQNVTCGHHDGSEKGRRVFPRAEVKSVKLTRYGLSSLGGAAIGGGAGAIIGVATSRNDSSFINLNAAYRAGCTLVGALGGTAVGATTDLFRGPTVYRRAETK